ncbi:MAG: AAA family ATPase, partial [Candidatus Methylomirabilales bacterium]
MRPLELSVEGFRSYREAQVFQFDGRGLFGIVGPTGAGKSSILDALIYALYGRTPRIGRETRNLINSSCDQARVHLVFEVADSCWEVTRIIRTRGSSQVVLRRQGEGSVEAAGEGKVNEAVSEIVGLD